MRLAPVPTPVDAVDLPARMTLPAAPAPVDDLELLSFRDVAKLLHCHRDAVAHLVATGRVKSVPVGRGLRRVPRWALRDYQASRTGAR
jgi:excisionase family DNA binding protein